MPPSIQSILLGSFSGPNFQNMQKLPRFKGAAGGTVELYQNKRADEPLFVRVAPDNSVDLNFTKCNISC